MACGDGKYLNTDPTVNFVNGYLSNNNPITSAIGYGQSQLQIGNITLYPYSQISTPIGTSISTIPTTIASGLSTWNFPDDKTKIFDIMRKIIDGGKKQLIFSLKSDDDLEKDCAIKLLEFLKMCKTEDEETKDK